MRLFKKFVNPLADLSNAYQTLKIICFILVILLGVLTYSFFQLSNREQIVVGIDGSGIPVPMEVKEENIENLINYKQFITYLLNCLYNWNSETYIDQIKKALPLMADDIQKDYLMEVEEGGYIDTINHYKITSSIQIRRFLEDTAREYKDGFIIEIIAVKLRVTDFIDRTSTVKVSIAFRPTDISNENIWGLEMFELKEQRID